MTTFKQSSGFSLVELVVIILLLGILSAVAMPRFFDQSGFQERGLYDEVIAAVRYGQKLAVASGCAVQVRLSSGGDAYGLYQRETDCTVGAFTRPVAEPAGGGAYRKNAADDPAGLIPSVTITFDSLGRSDVDGSYSIGSHSFSLVGETGYLAAP
ncbi:MAG: prepilin-type N-terminal cleavage/methylation domain-containing protein [Desulfuromonadales bacterium]|nr:prepilin-type N-terminal cleavage/methylation domain-containing protein [Desulfuromonadales bacterium]